jgi:pimeloyl-ACP methyl ester carboxylesterase
MTALTHISGGAVHVVDVGEGFPVIFQHGLGGDRNQVAESFPDRPGLRRVTVECRGHGLSPSAEARHYAIAGFADDVLAVADAKGFDRFVIGGISMGAAIALRLAVRHPERIRALVLVRPAWLWGNAPDNMQPFAEAGRLMRTHGKSGRDLFLASATGRRLAAEAPDNLASLAGFFDRDNLNGVADLLEAIACDGPGVREADIAALTMPVLVVGNAQDAVHPLDYAQRLAALTAGAHFSEITPKAVDRTRYTAELRAALAAFFTLHATPEDTAQ